MRRLACLLGALFFLIAACGGSDPAFTGTYPCAGPCPLGQYCFFYPPGIDGGAPAMGSCTPFGSCTSSPACPCLLKQCNGGLCGVASNQSYVVVCSSA